MFKASQSSDSRPATHHETAFYLSLRETRQSPKFMATATKEGQEFFEHTDMHHGQGVRCVFMGPYLNKASSV